MALTDRQKEIVALQKQGKKAPQIAEALGITTNAVYQQLRRIKGGKKGGSKPKASTPAKAKTSAAKKSTAKKSGAKKPTPVLSQPTPAPVKSVPRSMTPLQAIRARRDEVTGDLRVAEDDVAKAQKALDAAQERVGRVREKVAPELAQLDAAEAAIKGTLALPKPKAPAKAKPAAAKTTPAKPAAAKTTPAKPEQAQPAATTPQEDAAPAADAPKPDAAATPQPATQTEREATADDVGDPFTGDAAPQPEPVPA